MDVDSVCVAKTAFTLGERIIKVGEMAGEKEQFRLGGSSLLSKTIDLPTDFCFFKGPLFFNENEKQLRAFYKSVEHPIDVLKDTRRREGLINTINSINPNKTFFSVNGELPDVLEDILKQGSLYKIFTLEKDKKRLISTPQGSFRYFIENYILPFVKTLPVHPSCHGGEKGWSVQKSLETHLPISSFLSFDMKNAMGQATVNYVFNFFYKNLGGAREEERTDTAGFLASVCTVKKRYDCFDMLSQRQTERYEFCLPQGSPLSIAVFNRMLNGVDQEFNKFTVEKGIKYSRWIDDFIFTSGQATNFWEFAEVMRLAQESFSIAPRKVYHKPLGVAYLLGHKITYDKIEKVDREKFEKGRGELITGRALSDTHPSGNYIYMEDDDSLPD